MQPDSSDVACGSGLCRHVRPSGVVLVGPWVGAYLHGLHGLLAVVICGLTPFVSTPIVS